MPNGIPLEKFLPMVSGQDNENPGEKVGLSEQVIQAAERLIGIGDLSQIKGPHRRIQPLVSPRKLPPRNDGRSARLVKNWS